MGTNMALGIGQGFEKEHGMKWKKVWKTVFLLILKPLGMNSPIML
jgi:hypothetical protein